MVFSRQLDTRIWNLTVLDVQVLRNVDMQMAVEEMGVDKVAWEEWVD